MSNSNQARRATPPSNDTSADHSGAHPSPVVRRRLAEVLDALSVECEALARDVDASPESYGRVLHDIETLAEVLRESSCCAGEECTEWTLGDRAADGRIARVIERASGTRLRAGEPIERVDAPEQSGWCRTLTMEDARRVIEAVREEDAVRHDVQRAIG